MANVYVCYKWVPDESDVKVNTDQKIDLSKAKWKISEYDKNAIEAAVQAVKVLGGKAIGMTFGSDNAKQSLKDALSRGLDEVCWIKSDLALEADGFVTAKVLAAAVKKMEDISLVICAEGASDTYARQIAPRLGAELDWPVITSVSSIVIVDNHLTAERNLDDCIQTVEAKLPAVISVLPEVNEAPLPSLKAVIAASKKPVTQLSTQDIGTADISAKTKVLGQKEYVMVRKNILLSEGNALDKVKELAANLKKEGVL